MGENLGPRQPQLPLFCFCSCVQVLALKPVYFLHSSQIKPIADEAATNVGELRDCPSFNFGASMRLVQFVAQTIVGAAHVMRKIMRHVQRSVELISSWQLRLEVL
jgi:hypothetical protein